MQMNLAYFFFFNDTATTEIYTLSLHDALPISRSLALVCASTLAGLLQVQALSAQQSSGFPPPRYVHFSGDRKSTRLNSSHANISYAVFCLKKKKIKHRRSLSRTIESYACHNSY